MLGHVAVDTEDNGVDEGHSCHGRGHALVEASDLWVRGMGSEREGAGGEVKDRRVLVNKVDG